MKDTGVWYDSSPPSLSAKFRLASKNKLVYIFPDGPYKSVCVELTNYTPVNLEELI